MKLSRTLFINKLFEVAIITMVNIVLVSMTKGDNIPFIIFLAILFNSLLLFTYSLSWFPAVWAKEGHLTSSIFGFKRNYNYEDIVKISEVNYRIFKRYTPIQLTFRDEKTLIFAPKKNGLEYLLNIIKEKSLKVKIETSIE